MADFGNFPATEKNKSEDCREDENSREVTHRYGIITPCGNENKAARKINTRAGTEAAFRACYTELVKQNYEAHGFVVGRFRTTKKYV